MASGNHISVGSQIWVEDSALAWLDATVLEINGLEVKAQTKSGKMVITKLPNVHPKDPDAQPGGVDDMTKLGYLHEPGVLYNLASRYELNDIYTYTGNILIAVNPFTKLPHLYDVHMMEQYRGATFGELSPHVFAIADTAYRAMIDEGKSQSILVSGESGAGKTETTKLLMQYIAFMGGRAMTDGKTVEQQVLESNPLLEAFGNAKTVRNDNSSRFGKFVELQFDRSGRISGAAIRTYLLERSRVVQITYPERNYHCFYQLCASTEDAIKYKLGDVKSFHYLNQSKCYELNHTSNSCEYAKTRRAMDIVGISLEEQEAIFRVVAAILHLGNIQFVQGKEHDSSMLKDKQSQFHLQIASDLLMCGSKGLMDSLSTRTIVTRDENITKSLDPISAALNRDTFAKTIYSRLFDWLVDKVNKSIGQDPDPKTVIGVLDIYGFESFKTNSFEQFCINLTNEKLQQHFNQHVFKTEQDEYTKEEIGWSYIEFVDNQDVLDMIEKKPLGIIALLDEACMFPKSTHETFASKIFQTFNNHKRLKKPKLSRTDFIISHYAGDVTYEANLFLEKNKDYVVREHQALLGSSECPFVAGLFPALPEESSKSSYKFSSIGTRFKQQLQALMETLNSTQPHYIRCVKPNAENKPGRFENNNVLQQLRCGGVLEAVRISCAGYPTRRSFDEFIDRFGLLAPEVQDESFDEKAATEQILKKGNLSNYQIGKTKVFLRAGQLAELDARRAEVLGNAAKLIQHRVRTFLAQRELRSLRKVAICVQAHWRGKLSRNRYRNLKRESASIKIQKHMCGWQARKAFKKSRAAAIVIQACFRGMKGREEFRFRRQTRAAINIQTWYRGFRAHLDYKKLHKAALTTQCMWRGQIARKELKILKKAAKETGALQEAKTKLEKRCEELTWRLQLEKRLRTDLEEAKSQEISKLEAAITELQAQNTNALSSKEIIISRQVPTIKETEVKKMIEVSSSKVEKLEAENEHLMKLVISLEKKALDAEKRFLDAQKECEENSRKRSESDSKIDQLQKALQRFEEKSSNLESENQVLRHQSLMISPVRSLSNRFKSTIIQLQKTSESGIFANGATQIPPGIPSPQQTEKEQSETEQKHKKMLIDRQQENVDALLKCVTQNIGFSQDKPVAACIIYKSLVHWHSFEAERTIVFDRIIQTIGRAIENQENHDILAYWLSNISMLLFLLQRTLKADGVVVPRLRHKTSSVTLFERMAQGFLTSPSLGNGGIIGGLDKLWQVDAKYPALLFKQQLTAYVEKIYGMIRDNLKKEITHLLVLCIQAPRISRARSVHTSSNAQQMFGSHWNSVTKRLNNLLITMQANNVPAFLVRNVITQIFSCINVQLFNSLLLRRECCSFSNGEYLKAGLAELENWLYDATEEYAGSSWEELKHIRQAVGFLVIHQKPKKSLIEITQDLCPALSIQQLYRISTMYWDDKYGTQSLSHEIIGNMRVLMTEGSNHSMRISFLLDDDLSIPFSVDDISNSIEDIDLDDFEPPTELKENPGFLFLSSQGT